MKLNDYIAALQKISDQRGNPEVCFRDSDDWKRHTVNVTPKDLGFVLGVDDPYGFVPVDFLKNGGGFAKPNPKALKGKRQYERLLINLEGRP
jgi:hypothetical protein